jgi:hypothetical protein
MRDLLKRTWLVVAILAVLGLALGIVAALVLIDRQDRVEAQATLAMIPQSEIPLLETPNYWDILNQGQATRSAAIVLGDGRWLDSAATQTGVPRGELSLSASAIPETTLIVVAVRADSPEAAERVLDWVLRNATGQAASIVGPFDLRLITEPIGSARAMGAAPVQLIAAMALGGLFVGAGVGLVLSRSAQGRPAPGGHESPIHESRAVDRSMGETLLP